MSSSMESQALPPGIRDPLPDPEASVRCRDVASGYFQRRVLDGISFEIREPAIYVVLGPNGSGKTTLFRTLAGILRPKAGSVEIGGIPVDRLEARRRLHYLTHIDGIPDGLRVEEALRFWGRVVGAGEPDLERVLDLLGLRELRGKYFSQLSQGQKKRVSVARIFLRERQIYLLDEPTANLDPKMATEIRNLVLGLSEDRIVLYSSHNLFEAREIGRYVLALKDGRLAYFGPLGELRPSRYVLGIRVEEPNPALSGLPKEGDYFLQELAGPEEVPKFVNELVAKGVRIREVKEMRNPLEDLFT
ncbi:MAG: heme ABC exporter ATP-binding protein CcmA [Thermoplasmata archaeon]|nr:heme ABC exporter ATP-binding protein CcmA [Thermoplasmata archaeon]